MAKEKIPTLDVSQLKSMEPLEHFSTTKDTTDYLWFMTSIKLDQGDLPFRKTKNVVLEVSSLGHLLHAFVNGSGNGNNLAKSFIFKKPISLRPGVNNISILGATVGYPDSGSYLEHRVAGTGVRTVSLHGLNSGTVELSYSGWWHKIGLEGEKLNIFTEQGSHRFEWTKVNKGPALALTWYKTNFDAPEGNNPVAIQMETMSKGMIWVNGKSIGRYWSSYLSPLGKPSQPIYHIPRAFLRPKNNLLVILEEMGGKLDGIEILTVNRDTICSIVGEDYPPNVETWSRDKGVIRTNVNTPRPTANLVCLDNKIITQVDFASYGDPVGSCGHFLLGKCNAQISQKIVEQYCLGKKKCTVPVDKNIFDKHGNTCPGSSKTLAIQAHCGRKNVRVRESHSS
uniref:beta-galactosidase n=1 Tax=Cicer arietinum TaxID=3827 RepID=A0A3Q7XHW0_CICAR|nr:beta-galactosidase 13-like [Cicer arietinum]